MLFDSSFENNYEWIYRNGTNEETMSASSLGQDGLTLTRCTILCETTTKTQTNKQNQKHANYVK